MTDDKHDILTYSKLAEGAQFFLDQSFRGIHEALAYEYASELFGQRIASIEPTDEDRAISAQSKPPTDAIGLLRDTTEDVLTSTTTSALSRAWQEAQNASWTGSYRFSKDHEVSSILVLGHLNNLGFFLETLINRHLLFLLQTKAIDSFSYGRIATAKTMERIVYLFKEDLRNQSVQLNEIAHLFSLRNKTVHFTPDNASALRPKISELIRIWRQMVLLLERFESEEKFNEEVFSIQLKSLAATVEARWT